MCLLVFCYLSNPRYRFIAAANRDEFLSRPTASADYFAGNEEIVCGRDLLAGGTWLAIGSGERFGALTNYRDPALLQREAPSRGDIILNYLTGTLSAEDYLRGLQHIAHRYNGFNLVLLDAHGAYYYSNITNKIMALGPGLYGLSNHLLNSPWPKVERAKELLRPLLVTGQSVEVEEIFATLQDSWRPDDSLLPQTGIGTAWERYLSSMFIVAPNYGTRSSSVVTIEHKGRTTMYEQTYDHSNEEVKIDDLRRFTLDSGCK
jgi:uncharacterized protein with NRDE domain